MKAVLYMVRIGGEWKARWTAAWDVDRRFWLDPAFRRGVLEGGGVRVKESDKWGGNRKTGSPLCARGVDWDTGSSLCAGGLSRGTGSTFCAGAVNREAGSTGALGDWKTWDSGVLLAVLGEALPLGVAEAAAVWLGEQRGSADRAGEWEADTDEALRLLQAAADVCRKAADAAAKLRPGFSSAGLSVSGAVLQTPDGQRWEENEETRRDLGRRLGRLARRAASCLAGQSLLPEEAQRVLMDELPGMKREEWLPVVQTAHLLGWVELRAALAPCIPAGKHFSFPLSGRSPASLHGSRRGLRGWFEALIREPLRRSIPRSREHPLTGKPPRKPERDGSLRCRRCGSGEENMRRSPCASCGRVCAVCEACLTMGRCRECELLIVGRPERKGARLQLPEESLKPLLDRWKLSPAQRDASAQALAFIIGKPERTRRPPAGCDRRFLLWAVTGAGKTEMIFPLLDAVISAGGRALVATPRRDVVLELAPRLARAFGEDKLCVRYGGSPDRKRIAPLMLATTHQLLRYQEAFDLVLIDELDAFPYHGDPMLQFAAGKARRADGATVLLTATPPKELQREVKSGRLPCAKVPVRYHGHPLPEPRRLRLPEISRMLRTGRLPARLVRALRRSAEAGCSMFVFVPYVRQAEAFAELLRRHASSLGLGAGQIAGTSSQDAERGQKVQAFRNREVRLLVATTILERGVTVPRSDVFILDADNPMFDETALVQMAGRAGRSADAPDGRVVFAGRHFTFGQHRAIRHIRGMNRLARKKGYLVPSAGRDPR